MEYNSSENIAASHTGSYKLKYSYEYPPSDALARVIESIDDVKIYDAIEEGMKNLPCFVQIKENKNNMIIDDVIMNEKSTVVKWKDGTETHVTIKDGEIFDREKAFLYCLVKKAYGSLALMDKVRKIYSDKEKDKIYEIAIDKFSRMKHRKIAESDSKTKGKDIKDFDRSSYDETKEFEEFFNKMWKEYKESKNFEKI
jgi:hypothetical protein